MDPLNCKAPPSVHTYASAESCALFMLVNKVDIFATSTHKFGALPIRVRGHADGNSGSEQVHRSTIKQA